VVPETPTEGPIVNFDLVTVCAAGSFVILLLAALNVINL
jgi:hypothetical protein